MSSITIHHDGDGTTVTGTERGGEEVPALRAAGFRWSNGIDAWFLPRTWREPTRRQRVDQLARALGDRATVELGQVAKTTTADERAAAHVARAAELAERHAGRAEAAEATAEALHARSDQLVEGIPFGQPVLVGHHSQRRHERTLEKSRNLLGKAFEAGSEAKALEARAQSSAAEAKGYDEPGRVSRRIKSNGAELRRWQRSLAASSGADPEWTARAHAAIEELEDTIARDERVFAASNAATYSRETVQAGDLVLIRGRWYSVDKANPKTVAVTAFGLQLTYSYGELRGHRRPTPEELRAAYDKRHTSDLEGCLRSRKFPQASREVVQAILDERSANV